MAAEKIKVLLIGNEPSTELILNEFERDTVITSLPMDIEKILEPVDPLPQIVIVGPPCEGISINELAQTVSMQYQGIPVFFCSIDKPSFERKSFIKNGFTDAFLMPTDAAPFKTIFHETLAKISSGAIRAFRPVKIIDVAPGETLSFDTSVYLPANKKYVKVSNAGDPLDAERIDKMKKGKMNNVFVPVDQMNKFYEYSAKRLKNLNSDFTFSATERKEKLTMAVRELVSGLFTDQSSTFESGQSMLKDCSEIVKNYIMQGADSEWFLRIQTVLGDKGDTYSHAGNVSTLAALFSMGLGIGKPEDLALAGLLHDIGIAELPPELQSIEERDMTPEQMEEYKKHPLLSVNMIRNRKIVVSDIVSKAILQHHELYNGQGFPSGLFGDRICKEAQVLGLADKFEYLTRARDGSVLLSPTQAVEALRKEQVNDPSRIHYNPELIKKLLSLFPE